MEITYVLNVLAKKEAAIWNMVSLVAFFLAFLLQPDGFTTAFVKNFPRILLIAGNFVYDLLFILLDGGTTSILLFVLVFGTYFAGALTKRVLDVKGSVSPLPAVQRLGSNITAVELHGKSGSFKNEIAIETSSANLALIRKKNLNKRERKRTGSTSSLENVLSSQVIVDTKLSSDPECDSESDDEDTSSDSLVSERLKSNCKLSEVDSSSCEQQPPLEYKQREQCFPISLDSKALQLKSERGESDTEEESKDEEPQTDDDVLIHTVDSTPSTGPKSEILTSKQIKPSQSESQTETHDRDICNLPKFEQTKETNKSDLLTDKNSFAVPMERKQANQTHTRISQQQMKWSNAKNHANSGSTVCNTVRSSTPATNNRNNINNTKARTIGWKQADGTRQTHRIAQGNVLNEGRDARTVVEVGPKTLVHFLRSLELEEYHEKFVAEKLDLQTLKLLSDRDIECLGLPLGPRKRIQMALRKQRKSKASSIISAQGSAVPMALPMDVLPPTTAVLSNNQVEIASAAPFATPVAFEEVGKAYKRQYHQQLHHTQFQQKQQFRDSKSHPTLNHQYYHPQSTEQQAGYQYVHQQHQQQQFLHEYRGPSQPITFAHDTFRMAATTNLSFTSASNNKYFQNQEQRELDMMSEIADQMSNSVLDFDD